MDYTLMEKLVRLGQLEARIELVADYLVNAGSDYLVNREQVLSMLGCDDEILMLKTMEEKTNEDRQL